MDQVLTIYLLILLVLLSVVFAKSLLAGDPVEIVALAIRRELRYCENRM
jgi:hypothetical protein